MDNYYAIKIQAVGRGRADKLIIEEEQFLRKDKTILVFEGLNIQMKAIIRCTKTYLFNKTDWHLLDLTP